MDNKISVVINTYNAAQYLQPVLDSVKDFDEILICDMESTDDTVAIAERNGCRVVTFEKKDYNICEVARDFAIHSASYKWVFVVDADEIVPHELYQFLRNKVADGSFDGALCVGRRNPFMGKFVNSAPDYQLRFFQRDKATWPTTIHSRPVIDGKIYNIPARDGLMFIHLYDPSIAQRIGKMNTYTDYEVEKKRHRQFPIAKMLFRPVIFFLKAFVLGGGFKHGKRGVINAYLAAMYQMVLISKVVEYQETIEK